MSALIKDRLMTADEFWEWDDGSYELVDGVPRLMSPHSDKHGTMQGNVIRVVGNHIVDNDLPCRVVPEGGRQSYLNILHDRWLEIVGSPPASVQIVDQSGRVLGERAGP